MKIRLYFSLMLAMVMSSCELYMDTLPTPAETEGPDPKKEVVTVEEGGAKVSYGFTEAVVELTDDSDQYILSDLNDSILAYSISTPNSFLPKPGTVLFSKMREKCPYGLARVVEEVNQENGMFMVKTRKANYKEVLTDLDFDLTNAEYPTFCFTSGDEESRSEIRMPSSRAEGDVECFDDVEFTCTSQYDIKLSSSSNVDFKKYFTGSYEGELTLTIKYYQAILEDKVSLFSGNIIKHGIYMIKVILKGDAKISGGITFKPFKGLDRKMAAQTSTAGGWFGYVIHPDLKITLDMTGEYHGTYTQTTVYEIYAEAKDFCFEEPKMTKIENKYNAGSVFEGNVSGAITLTINLDLRLGIAFVDDIAEVGDYCVFSIKFSVTGDDDANCQDLIGYDDYDNPVYYKAHRNDVFSIKLEWEQVGIYVSAGVPPQGKEVFEDLANKFGKNSTVSANWENFIIVVAGLEESEVVVYINLTPIIIWLANGNSNPGVKYEWYFEPKLDTKKSWIVCTNSDNIDRTYNHIQGKLYFEDKGFGQFVSPSVLVYTYDNKYIDQFSENIGSTIIANKAYDIDFKLPLENFIMEDINYYNIYPTYMKWDTNSDYNLYCDRCFLVKNYRPSIAMRLYQNAYFYGTSYLDEVNDEVTFYGYTARSKCNIQTTSEISDWGLLAYFSKKKPANTIDENEIKKYLFLGSIILDKDSSGSYIGTNDGRLWVDLTLNSTYRSLNDTYLVVVPFYKKYGDKESIICYGDFEYTRLRDDEEINERYWYEQDEFADQYFEVTKNIQIF